MEHIGPDHARSEMSNKKNDYIAKCWFYTWCRVQWFSKFLCDYENVPSPTTFFV